MNFIFKLQHIAAVKIATTLWIHDDIKNIMIEDGFCELRKTKKLCYEAEEMVHRKVRTLPLPEFLKKKILDVVEPILFEIILWKHIRGRFLPLTVLKKAFNNLCWTSEGTVNEKKTAELLIKDEEIDITGRYELACIYCLESDITRLWDKLSEIEKEYLLYDYAVCGYFYTSKLVLHWTLCMKNASGDNKEAIECTNVFEYAVNEGNIAATEYTLQKLTPKERKLFLVTMAQNVSNLLSSCSSDIFRRYHGKVLSFLLSQMSEKQQMQIFQTYSYVFLKRLLDWPRQNFFLDTAKRLWDFLPAHECMMLNEDIIDKAFPHVYCYKELFRDFWQQSPTTHKKYVFDNCSSGFLIYKLFKINDLNSIKWILKDASKEEKSKIILCDRGQYICGYLMEYSKWEYLEFFILECIPSTNDIPKLEANLENLLSRRYQPSNADEMLKLKRFFKLLKDLRKDDKMKDF